MTSVVIALADLGHAMPLEEQLNGAGFAAKWDAALVDGPTSRQAPTVVLVDADHLGPRLPDVANAWRDHPAMPGVIAIGSSVVARAQAPRARLTLIAPTAKLATLKTAIEDAARLRLAASMRWPVLRAALGLPSIADTRADWQPTLAAGRGIDIAIPHAALRWYAGNYVTPTARLAELREERVLTVPELAATAVIDGTRTVQTHVKSGPLDAMQTARMLWTLTSMGALELTPEIRDTTTAKRRQLAELRAHLRARDVRLERSTFYDVLEISPLAEYPDIEAAYALVAARFSPQVLGAHDLADLAAPVQPMWELVEKARSVLVDHAARGRYHDWLRQKLPELRTVWAVDPKIVQTAHAAFTRGQQALGAGDVHKAMSDLAIACRQFSGHPEYEATLAWARYRVQVGSGRDRDEAALAERRTVENLLLGCKPWPRALVALALLCAAGGDTDSARWHLHTALTIDPTVPAAAALAQRLGMRGGKVTRDIEDRLHAARPGTIEAELVAIALEQTGAEHGALFVWDKEANGLALVHHVVGGVTVTLPRVVKHDGGAKAGIALHVFDTGEPYLSIDTSRDERYTRYLIDVGAIAAAPLRYQRRAIGVLTVSTRDPRALDAAALRSLAAIADVAAPLLRRVQVDKLSRAATGRPLMIKGLSPAWHDVERKLELAAPTNAPILIRGESGTGKDLVARAIHWNSRRADKPYVTVNCAAIPETLLESILFGHVKGAFTGASFHKVGEFQKADGGTLFLDEVGELPVMLQAKVLRAVEQGEVQPLGSNDPPDRVDVRLICATNRDLEGMAKTGAFRDDLFYRLSVMTLELPSLRSYKDNLETLANVFLEQSAEAHGKRAPRLGGAVLARLAAYDFPGNVRELKNTIEHAVILCTGDELAVEDLPKPLQSTGAAKPKKLAAPPTLEEARETWLEPLERQYLTDLLARHGGNVEDAARAAGINKVTLYRLLKRRGLQLGRVVQKS